MTAPVVVNPDPACGFGANSVPRNPVTCPDVSIDSQQIDLIKNENMRKLARIFVEMFRQLSPEQRDLYRPIVASAYIIMCLVMLSG